MEDSSEVHSEENGESTEKNTKRILKTPAQIMALEKFYNEHNYPTEEMKSELAKQIGLTEKQISSWFCHRRLKDKRLSKDEALDKRLSKDETFDRRLSKDETCAIGRQDRSSGIIQDRGSGLWQDSCGSTKQSDYRKVDLKEVESQRLYGHSLSAADVTYDHTSRYTGKVNGMDDTSSESSSSLQDKLFSQSEDPHDMKTSSYITQNGASRPLIPKGANNMGYKPSGYLKVKGEIENAAITAVKRQLGKHYREDGPPLGVEFQPLPPGAFSSSNRDAVNGVAYCVGNLARIHSPEVSGVHKQSSIIGRHGIYSSKVSSQDSYMKEPNCNLKYASDSHEKKSHHRLKKKASSCNFSNSTPGGKSAMDKCDDLAAEISVHSSKRNYKLNSKHAVEAIRPDTVSNDHHPDGGKVISEQTEHWLHDYGNGSPNVVQNNDYMSKSSNLIPGSSKSLDTQERVLYTRMAKEKLCGEMKGTKEYQDTVRVSKRFRSEFFQQDYVTKAAFPNVPRNTSNKGSAMERPSSFSEDETAETNSSVD
ncbi:homeobox-DDT domain protein RLT1 isoform X3 [Manihot esculenta]|uniref:homeobox-DDT domain protein RLT1 isoform X3 n=1 Tax=Manihot esculenta TaxID=3983 RepID=UPI000B5D57C6|nr:homeobox-DDT domain protein RLT1 isoform X3 [Manihot esculenta]